MTWVIINHVGDLIELSHEPPVQDFIRFVCLRMISLQKENYITANRIWYNMINFLLTFSAIHRNSAASGLFIQAINSRFENLNKVKLSSCNSSNLLSKKK